MNDTIAFGIGTQVYLVDGSPYTSLLNKCEDEKIGNKKPSTVQSDSPYVVYEFNKSRDGNPSSALCFDELEDDLDDPEITVSSLSFNSFGTHLAVGCLDGSISIVNIESKDGLNFINCFITFIDIVIHHLTPHSLRVNNISWNGPSSLLFSQYNYVNPIPNVFSSSLSSSSSSSSCFLPSSSFLHLDSLLASASQDSTIFIHDTRLPSLSSSSKNTSNGSFGNSSVVFKIRQHSQEVCGLSWNMDKTLLASGGNDNFVYFFVLKKFFFN
jgi:WD40 repeat protein